MDEKIEAVSNKLRRDMPQRTVAYAFTADLHKFRIDGGRHTHWLAISRELVADSSPIILINLLNIYQVVETMNHAAESRRLLLTDNGIQETD